MLFSLQGGTSCRERKLAKKLFTDAEHRAQLDPTPPDVEHVPGWLIVCTDGATVVGTSNTGSRLQIVSSAFRNGASKLDRFWDVHGGGEGRVFQDGQVCLTENEADDLREEWPGLGRGRVSCQPGADEAAIASTSPEEAPGSRQPGRE
jgi:hypothetical protein